MSSINDYANYVVRNLNLSLGQHVEIVSPLECKEFVDTLKDILISFKINIYITYNNEEDEYYERRNDDFYNELIKLQFARIIISSSFTKPKSEKYISLQSHHLKSYFIQFRNQKVVVAYPNENWARMLGITYLELKNRIIDLSIRNNPLVQYIDDLFDLDIKLVIIKNSLGTNLKIQFSDKFRFSDGYLRTFDGIPYKANIPSLEIFTSPLKDGVNGTIVGSKPLYVDGRIITNFKIDFKNGKIINSQGLSSIILDESLNYCGELGIAYYSDFTFYNTLLDENSATHIALGNSYNVGIKKSERNKLNKSEYHIDLPIGTKDMILEFYNESGKLVAIFDNLGFKFY